MLDKRIKGIPDIMKIDNYCPYHKDSSNSSKMGAITNERAFYVSKCLKKINEARIGTKYKPMTARGVALKVGHIKTTELIDFYFSCLKADCGFSQAFFGRLKV